MENKYYQPSIEEFYVGFEFESTYVLFQPYTRRHGDGGPEWYSHTLNLEDHGWFWDSYENDAYPTEFRVKYLDSTDIEELGFNQPYKNYFEIDAPGKLPAWIKVIVDIRFGLDNVTIRGVRGAKTTTLFRGNIKNKSELKKILKCLNIN